MGLLFSQGKDSITSELEVYKKAPTQPFNPDCRILDNHLCSLCLSTSGGTWCSALSNNQLQSGVKILMAHCPECPCDQKPAPYSKFCFCGHTTRNAATRNAEGASNIQKNVQCFTFHHVEQSLSPGTHGLCPSGTVSGPLSP